MDWKICGYALTLVAVNAIIIRLGYRRAGICLPTWKLLVLSSVPMLLGMLFPMGAIFYVYPTGLALTFLLVSEARRKIPHAALILLAANIMAVILTSALFSRIIQ